MIIVDCVAVGYVFSIVYSRETRTIIVVSTVTGEFLFQHQMSDTWDEEDPDPLYAPIDQQWLNSLDVDKEELPLAITLSHWKNLGLLSCTLEESWASFLHIGRILGFFLVHHQTFMKRSSNPLWQ